MFNLVQDIPLQEHNSYLRAKNGDIFGDVPVREFLASGLKF